MDMNTTTNTISQWDAYKAAHSDIDWEYLSCSHKPFVESVLSQGARKGSISDKQLDALRRNLPATSAEQAASGQDLEPGIYIDAEDAIWKVQQNKAKTNVYAKVWVGINGQRLTLSGDKVHGEWEYVPGGLRSVIGTRRMSLEDAKAFIVLYGSCVRCGRHLKAADSVERGIGPTCVKYFGGWGKSAPAAGHSDDEWDEIEQERLANT